MYDAIETKVLQDSTVPSIRVVELSDDYATLVVRMHVIRNHGSISLSYDTEYTDQRSAGITLETPAPKATSATPHCT